MPLVLNLSKSTLTPADSTPQALCLNFNYLQSGASLLFAYRLAHGATLQFSFLLDDRC